MTVRMNIAQHILDSNKYTISNMSIVNLELNIDKAVDYINLLAGTSIAHVSSNDLTASDSELMVVETLSALLIRASQDRGPQVGVGGMAVTAVISDPQYRLFSQMVKLGINSLRGRSFERT